MIAPHAPGISISLIKTTLDQWIVFDYNFTANIIDVLFLLFNFRFFYEFDQMYTVTQKIDHGPSANWNLYGTHHQMSARLEEYENRVCRHKNRKKRVCWKYGHSREKMFVDGIDVKFSKRIDQQMVTYRTGKAYDKIWYFRSLIKHKKILKLTAKKFLFSNRGKKLQPTI